MSMIGEYMRLAPQDLDKALSDPAWIRDLIDELWDSQSAGGEPDMRLMDIDKAWHRCRDLPDGHMDSAGCQGLSR